MSESRTTRVRIIVPREPTKAMLEAARDWSYAKYGRPIGDDAAIGCWTAMVEAGGIIDGD